MKRHSHVHYLIVASVGGLQERKKKMKQAIGQGVAFV